jgi:methylmalonyl-CoA/ethylmalonyl-CoA epimerase
MIVGLDHIAIAVPDLDKAIRRFMDDFGLTFQGQEDISSASTSTAFFPLANTSIELVHPLNGAGPIQKYLEKKGGGMHHLCFRSDNIEEDILRLTAKGYEFLSEQASMGAHNSKVIFIHPKSCDGVLVELSQPMTDSSAASH